MIEEGAKDSTQSTTLLRMNSFYYSLKLQNAILIGTRILFFFSCIFNAIAFFCLLKETPPHQGRFRNYLLCIQVFAAISDINFDVAVEPFPMFPAIGGFCKGIVCQWSVPIQYSFATTVLLISLIGFAISICILYRHQSIVRGRFKLSNNALAVLRTFLLALCSTPGIVSFCVFFDKSRTEELIDSYKYGNLTWIRERGMYAMFLRSPGTTIVIPVVAITVVLVVFVFLLFLLSQIIWFIFRDALRSASSRKRSRNALIILVLQLCVPILLIVVPANIIMISVLWETLIPFEVCQVAFFALYPHSLIHSLALLFITPGYRKLMRRYLNRLLRRKVEPDSCIQL